MGLFGDLDVKSAEDNPWFVPSNTYKADVFSVEVKDGKNGKGLSIVYKISEGDHKGKTVSEWKNIPSKEEADTEEGKKAASYLKMRLASLGVPEARMNDVEPADLTGTAVIVTVKVNGEYSNVNKVELAEGADTPAAPTQAFSGFGG